MSFIITMLSRSIKCSSVAVGAVVPSLFQTVKVDTRKAGKGHGRPRMTKKERYRIPHTVLLMEKKTGNILCALCPKQQCLLRG